jgi:sarcosine oxidase subunit gamma
MARVADIPQRRITPITATFARLLAGSNAACRIEPIGFRTVVNLRAAVGDGCLVTDLQQALGIELSLTPNRWCGDERMAGIWLGPDEWLLMAPDGEARDIEQAIRDARPFDPWLSVVDLSHAYSGFSVSGSRMRDTLARGCPLDLHARSFGRSDCAQSMLAKAAVLLRCMDDAPCFELWVRNSFARYTALWLLDAATTT